MKRLEQLITMARKLSGNTSYDGNISGVPQDVFVQYFNNAQDFLMKNVVNLKSKYFKTSENVTIVPGQTTYAYPYNIYMHAIDTIQWFDSLYGQYYQTLTQSYTKERVTANSGYAFGYIPKDDGYDLNPPLDSGILQVTYERTVPRLQTKNGKISSLTLVGSTLSALSVSTTESYNSEEINDDFFLCVVDKYGNQKARNIEYSSQAAGVFTLSSQTLGTGQTIAVGDYITIGKNTINLPQWPDVCETFLLDFAVYSAKYGDSSKWSQEAKDYMKESFASLASSFASPSDDINQIPITNLDYIGF